MPKTFHKVVYKPDSQSTDEFMVIVNEDVYTKWIKGDKTIPLAEVVESFDVFHTGQGAQGILGRASKQQLDTVFGTANENDCVLQVLEKGQLQQATVKDGFQSKNDSKHGGNQVSGGAVHGGR